MDLQEMATAVATTIGTVSASSNGDTETAVCTADMPDNIGKLGLVVYPPTGVLDMLMGPHHNDDYTFPVRLLRDPISMPGRSRWMYAWATALRTKLQAHVTLGLTYVTNAEFKALRIAPDGQAYSSAGTGRLEDFDVVEFEAVLHVWELTTASL